MSTIRHFVCCCACVVSAGWSSRLTRLESSADDSVRHHHPCFTYDVLVVVVALVFVLCEQILWRKRIFFSFSFFYCVARIGSWFIYLFGNWNTLIQISAYAKNENKPIKIVLNWLILGTDDSPNRCSHTNKHVILQKRNAIYFLHQISIEILQDSSPKIIYTHMHIEIPSLLYSSSFIYIFLLISSSFFFLSCLGGIFLFGSNRYSTYFHILRRNRHGHTLIISSHSHPTLDIL